MSFLLYLLLFVSSASFAQNHLIEAKLITTYSKEALQQKWKEQGVPELIAPVNYSIQVYELMYYTSWHDGTKIKASGLYFVPFNEGDSKSDFPVVCYHHGTQIKAERKVQLGGEQAICVGFAADGYLVVMPDYIGLGKGEKSHLYHHVPTQAGATIDMMRAVREFNEQIAVQENGLLFSTGYSQGGHAALSFHKVVQENYADEFRITASVPMSGAYDLAGVQEKTMFEEYSHPGYLPYLFFSFQKIYNFYEKESEVFKSPYDTLLPPLYQGKHTMGHINRLIPKIPKDVIKPEVVNQYLENDDFPFKVALRENSVHDWKPESPVLFCYCQADEQVNYLNSVVAHQQMKDNGAKNIRIKHVNKHLGHNDCAMFSVMHAKLFFDSFRNGSKNGRLGNHTKRFLLSLGKQQFAAKVKKKNRAK
jgi:acetyl esterase/lipase